MVTPAGWRSGDVKRLRKCHFVWFHLFYQFTIQKSWERGHFPQRKHPWHTYFIYFWIVCKLIQVHSSYFLHIDSPQAVTFDNVHGRLFFFFGSLNFSQGGAHTRPKHILQMATSSWWRQRDPQDVYKYLWQFSGGKEAFPGLSLHCGYNSNIIVTMLSFNPGYSFRP